MYEFATGWAPIEKIEKQSDGTLIVEGPVADSGLDRDLQILDEKWLSDAVPQWMAEGGNIRAQHRADSAAGVALQLKSDAGVHRVAARIVDPVDVAKCEAKVYKGFSVGIKRPQVVPDKAAPGGRVVGGQIIEVSLVDRPCNPRTLLTVAKADGSDVELLAEPERVDKADIAETLADLVKRDFNAKERAAAADSGAALPDGSFPIENGADLANAIHAVGRAKDEALAKSHIVKRAKALGLEKELPEGWKTEESEMTKADVEDMIAKAIAGLKPEAPAATKADNTESETPAAPEFLTKADMADLYKSAEFADVLTAAVTKAQEPILDRLAKVEAQPENGGPVVASTASAASPEVSTKAELLKRADAADRDGHSTYAEGLRARAEALPA